MPMLDSINSTKQVDSKLLRPIIKFMKQMLDAKMITRMTWCDSCVCLADILTKSGFPLVNDVMDILKTNNMIELTFTKKGKC